MAIRINSLISNEFSTAEKIIGTWMNKILYSKTIIFNDRFSAGYPVEKKHNISNIDTIFIDTSHSFIVNSLNNNSVPLPTPCCDGNFDDVVGVQVDANNIYLYGQTTWNTDWQKVITLNYTKIADED